MILKNTDVINLNDKIILQLSKDITELFDVGWTLYKPCHCDSYRSPNVGQIIKWSLCKELVDLKEL